MRDERFVENESGDMGIQMGKEEIRENIEKCEM